MVFIHIHLFFKTTLCYTVYYDRRYWMSVTFYSFPQGIERHRRRI